MPVISRFFGIIIYMFWRDHEPPHFHAKYGEQEVIVEIVSGLVTGSMAPRALALVQEWRLKHQSELADDWELARLKQALHPIEPLE